MSITRTDGASGAYFEVSATVAAGKGVLLGSNGVGWAQILSA